MNLFFELLQVAIGNLKELSRLPQPDEWNELFAMAKKQAMAGITFNGVQQYAEQMPKEVYLQWMGLAARLAQRNKVTNKACMTLTERYAHDGLHCCVLKGQGNLINYPEALRQLRNPGDIDVWCTPADPCGLEIAQADLDGKGAHYEKYTGHKAVIEYALLQHRLAGTKPHDGVRHQHVDAPDEDGVKVEVHFRVSNLFNPIKNRRLQNWTKDHEQFLLKTAKVQDYTFPVPTNSFNAVYQMVHMYHHFFDEGIGLRQLLDYYFVLKSLHTEQGEFSDRTQSMAQWAQGMGISVMSNEEIMHQLKRFGLKKFAGAVMWVLLQVFDNRQQTTDNGQFGPETRAELSLFKLCRDDGPILAPQSYASEQVRARRSQQTTDNGQQTTDNGQQTTDNLSLRREQSLPWMICQPDEKEGMFLLKEIMLGGNFGQHDERIRRPSKSPLKGDFSYKMFHAWEKTKHNMRLFWHYPEEVILEPFFRVYHFLWRMFR